MQVDKIGFLVGEVMDIVEEGVLANDTAVLGLRRPCVLSINEGGIRVVKLIGMPKEIPVRARDIIWWGNIEENGLMMRYKEVWSSVIIPKNLLTK